MGSEGNAYIKLFLGHIVRMQERDRHRAADFGLCMPHLQEASDLLQRPILSEASSKNDRSRDLWRQFALACASDQK